MTNKKKKSRAFDVIIAILFFIAACILVYPTFTDSICDIDQTMVIGGYAGTVEDLSSEEISRIRKEAEEYNEKIYEKQVNRIFEFGDDYYTDEYDSILKTDDTNTMAYVEIPKINVYLPIVHGTNMTDLKTKIGHLVNTSVPVGGANTHAVITGHTGLVSAELFTNVEYLEEGDEVYIHVLDETLRYRVETKTVVTPGEEMPQLLIEEGRDLITLYTCTPYGINDCRLLVKCVRDGNVENTGADGTENQINTQEKLAILHTVFWGIIPFIVLAIGLYFALRKKKKKKSKRKVQRAKVKM